MADTRDLKSLGVTTVRVRAPPPAPLRNDLCMSDDRLGRVHLDSKGLSSFKPAIADAGLQGVAGLFFLKIAPYSTNPRLAARIDARRGVSSFQNRNRSCGLRFCFRNIINNSNRKMEWILHGKFSAQVSPIKLRYAPCKPRITARLGWQ